MTQTELDLANAVLLIQEREAELARVRKEREQLFTAHSQEMTRADKLAIELDQIKQTPAIETPKPVTPKPVYNTPVPNLALTADDADNSDNVIRETSAGFGTKFPDNPGVGDMFLRVDMLPNKLYKWNGKKWIEIEKTTTNRYIYEEEYIKYITNKVANGEYDFYELSKQEQEEVLSRLDYNTKSKL